MLPGFASTSPISSTPQPVATSHVELPPAKAAPLGQPGLSSQGWLTFPIQIPVCPRDRTSEKRMISSPGLVAWSNSSHSPYYCRSRRRLASSGLWYPNVPAQRKRWRSTYVRSRGNVEDEVTVRFAVRAMRRSQDSGRMQLRSEKMVAHRAEKRKGTRPEKSVCDSKAKIARLGAVDPQFPTR